MLGYKTSQCQRSLKTGRLKLFLEIYCFTDPQILFWSTDVMLCSNFFEELTEKKTTTLVNDYIVSSNSARKYNYIYIITDMRTYWIIETVKPRSHLSFNYFKKELHFKWSRVPGSAFGHWKDWFELKICVARLLQKWP